VASTSKRNVQKLPLAIAHHPWNWIQPNNEVSFFNFA
jgi:hypothetical protein